MDKFEPIVKTYYDALETGKILARKCNRCGACSYPPMPVCHECSCTDTQWAELSGKGKLLTVGTLNDHHIWPSVRKYLPARWGEVELADGPIITAMILGVEDEESVSARLPVDVEAEIIQDDGFKTVVFRVAE